MEIRNSFDVPLPPADAWKLLLDVERIAPCVPGAELTGVEPDKTYNGKVGVRLGPVALSFAGQVKFTEINDAARTARLRGQGKDAKGRGSAHADVDFEVVPSGAGSTVNVKTDVTLSGAVAQYGRASGMIQEVANQVIGEFANNLRAQLMHSGANADAGASADVPPPPPPAKPISGFSLMFKVLLNSLRRMFGGKS
jgi:carbon monoxide dehydrogenase subunit G